MNLEDFVSDSIVEIVSGIKNAQDRLKTKGIVAAINPVWAHLGLGEKNIQSLEFDVAITAASKDQLERGAGASIGIQVVGANIGAKKQATTENSSISRVKFSLPFIPPSTTVDASK
ncbi:MAG TPA: hypothetical protein VNU97_18305 [Rhizomicrobium sp.]|jgi:hypothetical protein|nr:hypothetical protein [Rhizomicrobium sp.]